MSSAAERAEARRKAILAKRGDRLAKLTTTARGDEGTYLSDDVSSRSKAFLGEEPSTDMPIPSVFPSPGPTPSKSASPPIVPSPPIKPETLFKNIDDSVWSPELQEQFRHALLNANPARFNPSGSTPSGATVSSRDHGPGSQAGSNPLGGQGDPDPLAEMLASLGGGGPGQSSGLEMFDLLQKMRQGVSQSPEPDKLKRDKAIRRIIQFVSAWLLLAYFVFFLEPKAYRGRVGSLDVGRWSRWAILGENKNMLELLSTFIVQPQPAFFWAFIGLEAALHFSSLRNIFTSHPEKSHLDTLGPVSKIFSVVNIIMLFLSDLGSVIFGLGLVVFLAGYAVPK